MPERVSKSIQPKCVSQATIKRSFNVEVDKELTYPAQPVRMCIPCTYRTTTNSMKDQPEGNLKLGIEAVAFWVTYSTEGIEETLSRKLKWYKKNLVWPRTRIESGVVEQSTEPRIEGKWSLKSQTTLESRKKSKKGEGRINPKAVLKHERVELKRLKKGFEGRLNRDLNKDALWRIRKGRREGGGKWAGVLGIAEHRAIQSEQAEIGEVDGDLEKFKSQRKAPRKVHARRNSGVKGGDEVEKAEGRDRGELQLQRVDESASSKTAAVVDLGSLNKIWTAKSRRCQHDTAMEARHFATHLNSFGLNSAPSNSDRSRTFSDVAGIQSLPVPYILSQDTWADAV
ncbi:hypothetical protein R3P38DRAFT_2760113 [Favolaschia claudopus]|uniref:Uncharacterized protein n=1 Tax=Favolaschia claudopus TaxID=2862362 RepID=A0AAW0E2F8_9AGAR